MDLTHETNDEQSKLWNGSSGRAWVETQDLLDRVLQPFEPLLLEGVAPGSRVLDIGCGTGATTLAATRLLGASGSSTGIDISAPMIATARARAEDEGSTAQFICADAQVYAFEPASFDAMISRFGVMFFGDPVRAFANLHRAAMDGAELRFVAWRSAAENPFMTAAERAAAPLLPNMPPRRPDAPGQFALADGERVANILKDSGWTAIEIDPVDVTCTLPEKDLMRYVSRLGPVGLTLQDADEKTRARVLQIVRRAFDPYVHGSEVRFTAACWRVRARSQSWSG